MAAVGNQEGDSSMNNTEMDAAQQESKPLIAEGQQDTTAQPKDFQPKSSGVPQNQFEDGFYKNFMNPMLSKMEDHVKKNNEILDEITEKLEKEREQRRKDDMSKHIPELLKGHGQDLPKIMKNLQNLIVFQNYDQQNDDESKYVPARLKELDENSEACVLSHSVAAFVSTLEPSHLKHLANTVITDTATWIAKLFRFEEGSAYFHDEEREGLLRVCRLALHRKYPKYSTDGYNALYTRPPVIYINSASRPGLSHYICAQLGLPQSCICTVPHWRNTHRMDVKALEKLIEDDASSGKTPVLIIAYAGTPVLGHVDNLDKIKAISKKNDTWVHCEGNNLACLTMFRVPTEASPAKLADSMSLNLTGWLGMPALPYVTLYRCPDPAQARYAGLTYFNPRYKLSALPLWVCIQNLGHEGFVDRVQESIGLAKVVHETVDSIPTIKNVSKRTKPPPDPNDPNAGPKKPVGLGGMIAKAISALVVFNIENPTVVFRYQEQPPEKKEGEIVPNGVGGDDDDDMPQPAVEQRNPYYDALNIWLCETLKRDCPRVHLDAVELEDQGVCIRFAPMETMHIFDTRKDDVALFSTCLTHQLAILDATVRQREEFHEIVNAQDNLRLVMLPNWAGLGAVQYVPEQWVDKVDNLPDHGRHEVTVLNSHLVQQLKSADTAFSLGQSQDGLTCVRFGLITEETDLEELIALVYTTGKEVEESSKFLETMAEVVRQGIEKAQEDLQKESQNKLAQEGVLRQVPMIGSLWNWFSPPPKEAAVKGRTFSLASGQVASTEDTYKYHMQVQETSPAQSPRSREPVPLKTSLKPRRKSHNSTSSSVADPPTPSPQSPADAQTPPRLGDREEQQQQEEEEGQGAAEGSQAVVDEVAREAGAGEEEQQVQSSGVETQSEGTTTTTDN